MALTDKLTAIANAIRAKTGSTDTMTLAEMATAISNISTGSVQEPYIEETYDSSGNLIDAKLHGYTKIREGAFDSCSNLALTSLPDGVTSIGKNAFYSCSNLALTSLPDGVTSIGKNAFYRCSKLTLTSLPSGVTSIEESAFTYCYGLVSLTFEGKPSMIHSSAFSNCNYLKTINVPWAEGEVANAPWGANYATINYNYTSPTTEVTA